MSGKLTFDDLAARGKRMLNSTRLDANEKDETLGRLLTYLHDGHARILLGMIARHVVALESELAKANAKPLRGEELSEPTHAVFGRGYSGQYWSYDQAKAVVELNRNGAIYTRHDVYLNEFTALEAENAELKRRLAGVLQCRQTHDDAYSVLAVPNSEYSELAILVGIKHG